MVGEDNDWDLQAVVRSCNTSTATEKSLSNSLSFEHTTPDMSFSFPAISNEFHGFHELHHAYMSFLPPSQPATGPILGSTPTAMAAQTARPARPARPAREYSQTSKSRKRKKQQKKTICHVTEDNLCTDMWAWRKYGQKPIKGSPYPRNYYRCSSSKGCGARKQVERSNSDPETFTVTYTGDHTHPRPTHRNSLAGSSRTKNPLTGQTGSPVIMNDTDTDTDEEEEDEDILIPNMAITDQIFLAGTGTGTPNNNW